MKTLVALSAAALLSLAGPALAANNDETTTKPNGTAGATSGTDTKGGSMTPGMSEGRSSVVDPSYNGAPNNNGATTKPNGMPGGTSGTDPKN